MLTGSQSREYTRAQKLNILFGENASVIATVPPFANEVADFSANITSLNALVPNKDVVTKGITLDKLSLQQHVANEMELICKNARAFALKTSNEALAADMNFSARKIMHLKDSDILPLAQHIQSVLTPLLLDAAFIPYGITAAMLSNAVSNATTFNSNIGKADVTGSGSTVANKNINAVIKLLHDNIVQFDLLIGNFQTSYPDFVAAYHINSAVDNTGVHHSGIEGVVTDAATAQPIAGAEITFVNESKSAKTDLLGHYAVSRVVAGNYTVEVSAAGYTAKSFIQQIRRGQITEVNVVLSATEVKQPGQEESK